MEERKRSILKALIWRAIATITTVFIVYIYTREMTLALGVGVVEVVSKMVLYYGHERLWARIRWGKTHKPGELAESARIDEFDKETVTKALV